MQPQHSSTTASNKAGFYHPGLDAVSQIIQSTPRARVLDLGAPSAASFNYFKSQNCHVRFENLNDFLINAIDEQLHWDSQAFIKALDNYLNLLPESEIFDVILTWDIFCYLDEHAAKHLSERLARHSNTNTKMHMVRYWGNVYPPRPCEFNMISADSASNNFDQSEKRHYQKLPSLSALQKSMPSFKLQAFCINEKGMHQALTDVLFSVKMAKAPELEPPAANPSYRLPALQQRRYEVATEAANDHKSMIYGHHKSPAVKQLFKTKLNHQARILDLGAYNPTNEAVYRRYTPHILFANIPQLMRQPDFGNSKRLPSLFPLRQNWTFDVVMGWDVLCRYDTKTISWIMQLLRAHIHPRTSMHLLHYVGTDRNHVLDKCNLLEEDHIELVSSEDGNNHVRHSIFELTCAIGYGKIEQSFLFGAGMHDNYHEYFVNLAVR